MSKEKVDYSTRTLDPQKDVLVNPAILVELQKFTNMVKNKHTSYNFPQQTTWFDKKTHKPIDSKKKISDEKRNEDYYQNINLVTTEGKGEVVYDELGISAIKLQAAYEEIFRYNVDQGNSVPREPETLKEDSPQPVADES